MLTVRFVLPLPQGSSQAVRQGVSQKCNHQAHRRFYLYPCLSTEMIDALERRRVNHCYHAGHRPRRHVVRPPPITPITQNQADLSTAGSTEKATKKAVPHEFPRCCPDAPVADPCRPRPWRPFPRWAPRYSAERTGTAPVAIDAGIRRRYGAPRTERRRRPPGPREVAESCPGTWSTRRRR